MGRKSKQSVLDIFINVEHVGTLTRATTGALAFSYSDQWIEGGHSMPISGSLPISVGSYRGPEVFSFFDNLLPDNDEIRTAIAGRVAADGTGPFDLLSVIGRDCVGALQFLPKGEKPTANAIIQANPIKEKEIGDILRGLKKAPLGLDPKREFRISITGAQEKTALLRQGGSWFRPRGATPTTHILKPALGRLPNGIDMSESVENEWACLQLAEHFGLNVSKAEIATFDHVRCLVVERFDRRWSRNGKKLERIHQEDICQASGIPWTKKYESDGGPGIVDIMKYLNSSDERDRDRSEFMRSQLIFFLLGATDGHGKNFSVFLVDTGFRLTPLYDVMSIHPALAAKQLEPREAVLAMKVGGKGKERIGRIDKIRGKHWEETAKSCGFPFGELNALIKDLIERNSRLDEFCDKLKKQVPAALVDEIAWGIRKGLSTFLPLHK